MAFLKIMSVCIVVMVGFATKSFAKEGDPVRVAIVQITAHGAADAIRKGIEDVLRDNGYKKGENLKLTVLSAQGRISTATQIARKLLGEKPDVIVAISTPAAQIMAAVTKGIPIIFSAISDPIGAKLVPSLIKPGGNLTGVSDRTDISDSLALLQEVEPNLKKVGYLYNASEANSVLILSVLRDLASKAGIEIVPSSTSRSSDIQAATRALIGKVDMIFVPTDNTILSVLEGATKIAIETKTPLFTLDYDTIGRGPFMTQGMAYYDVGIDTGKLVVRVLKGEKPADINVVQASSKGIGLDMKVARESGISIPQAIIRRAAKVIQ